VPVVSEPSTGTAPPEADGSQTDPATGMAD